MYKFITLLRFIIALVSSGFFLSLGMEIREENAALLKKTEEETFEVKGKVHIAGVQQTTRPTDLGYQIEMLFYLTLEKYDKPFYSLKFVDVYVEKKRRMPDEDLTQGKEIVVRAYKRADLNGYHELAELSLDGEKVFSTEDLLEDKLNYGGAYTGICLGIFLFLVAVLMAYRVWKSGNW
jgi:hypothetical protein